MVEPIQLDEYVWELSEGIIEIAGGNDDNLLKYTGIYTVREDNDAVTYEVAISYLWKPHGGVFTCSNCVSMGDLHDSSPGTSGSVHPNCLCELTTVLVAHEIGRRQGADCTRCEKFFYTSDMKNGYCLDCLEILKKGWEDKAPYFYYVGISLEGVAALVAIVSNEASAAFEILGLGLQGYDRHLQEAVKDPPDESYKELVELMEVDLDLEPGEEEVSNLHIMEAVKATINLISNFDAYRRSMEKFTYAASVFDRKYINLHGESVIKYKEGVIMSLQEQIESFQTFGSTIKGTHFDIELKPEHINEFQAKLQAEGFNEQQLNLLQKFGLDTDAINELKEKIINTDSSKFTGKLSDILTTFVTEIETFKNNMMSIGH